MKRLTLKDIAKALNLSVPTISKALSDSHEIKKETKEKIVAYAHEHNYQYNALARSLKTGKTNIIGVIVSTISNSFFSQILEGIEESSLFQQYNIIIMQSRENPSIEKKCIDILYSKGVDGILISPVSDRANLNYLEQLHNSDCPIVIFDRINNSFNTFQIGIDNKKAAKRATQELIDRNYRNILHITGLTNGVTNERLIGFQEALKQNKIIFDETLLLRCDLSQIQIVEQQILSKLKELEKEQHLPDAIFTATDLLTNRTIGLLAQQKIKIPEEIALIGFSNTNYAFSFNPPLTCISQPAKNIGKIAFEKMIHILEYRLKKREIVYETIELDADITIRESI
ncbi:LacI family DNA-binding transcriptional regulator [Sphingobacterium faecium]|uniref:LacI family DNA-binding transcriptional regulator n=1 Tax=Sphingobacterium faecium TaxID=34087 RepID=UPI00097EB16F|nr:LacI family DNA-binding transcriptional regulator [Sphingobacterium faecium]WGQ13407.1 LacI family DNA-binding transcriptional regulator [Sphingobacterium faecium]SJN16831.1 LacI family transcriptional regulator [Sphingobacterium faecium PCAi_F2.5]